MLVTCGGGNGSSSSAATPTGTVNTSISDPPAICAMDYDHVYVTITKVRVNTSANADANANGWVDIVDLTSSPKQVDLMHLDNALCQLTNLGSKTLAAGKYQQIRLVLLANDATPPNDVTLLGSNDPNACGSSATTGPFNCVVPTGGSAQELQLSSEAQTGIKIPTSQISQGGLTVPAGETVDLDIHVSTCESLVKLPDGTYRLKPVLHAGEVDTTQDSIKGRVIVSGSNPVQPVDGAMVALEQPDANNVDRITDSTTTGSDGTFGFCILDSTQTYDIVADAMTTDAQLVTTTYNATVTRSVTVGSDVGDIPLVPEPTQVGTTTTTSGPANIVGQVTSTANASTSSAASTDATAAVITLSALQDAGSGFAVTIPPFSMMPTTTSFTTGTSPTVDNGVSGTTCPTGTKCENYKLVVPASNPSVGTFTAGQTTNYSTPSGNPALYWVEALSALPSDTTQTDCSPSFFPPTLTPGAGDPTTGQQIGVDPPPLTDNTATLDIGFVSCTASQ